MVDEPEGADPDGAGADPESSARGDETVEGIGGDPFPGGDDGAALSAAADAAAFEPVAAGPADAGAVSPGTGDGEDSASHASQVQIGTGHSGIFSPSDILSEASSAGARSARSRWILADDGRGDGAAPPVEGDAPAPPATEPPADPDEWRDIQPAVRDETASESIGFGAFLASTEGGEPPGAADSLAGDSQGIGGSTFDGLDLGGAAAGARRPASRDDGGAMRRQLVGVILGGMLALPVTQAILLWGLQRDPLRVTRHVPDGLRFLLPAKFRGHARRDEPVVAPPRTGLDALAAAAPEAPAAGDVGDPAAPLPAALAAPEPAPEPVSVADEATLVVEPPPVEGLGAARAAAPAVPDALQERIAAALEAADRVAGSTPTDADPALLVAWYRDLAEAAALLAGAERGPESALESAVARFDPLAERLASEHAAVLESLGGMWLASATRPIDGAVLVGRLEELRQVGPWWGGAVAVGTEEVRRVSFLCREAPRAAVGERILVAGVIVDPSTMWVSAIRGVPAPGPADDAPPPE